MKLFEPVRIGSVEFKNRIIMAPMVTGRAEEGIVSAWHINYYARRAAGGCGLIIVEGTGIDPNFCPPFALRLDNDRYIPGMAKLAEAIKSQEVKVIFQTAHPGKQTSSKFFGRPTLAPSAVPCPVFKEDPHVLTIGEIQNLVEQHIRAAVRAKEAGFDGIEIHAAHGYLLSQFFSSWDNLRTDQYGGNVQGRARFAVEIVQGIREILKDFLIFFRTSAEQYVDGVHLEDTKKIVPLLEEAGVDALHISAGRYASVHWMIPPMSQPQGCLVPLAAEIHRIARKPVVAVGRISTPELAEEILRRGDADLIALGRPLFADPDYPKKAKEGQSGRIRPCIACNTCFDNIFIANPVKCLVNPELKHGKSAEVQPSGISKKVIVVGGGPGGMEAALTLAQRGHRVSLWEKNDRLGGQLLLALASPGRSEFKQLIDYYHREFKRLNIELNLGQEATLENIIRETPDVVFVATGVHPVIPEIKGLEGARAVTAHDVLAGQASSGERVVIIGGGHTGCETAKYLAKKGKKVTVLRRGPRMAIEAGWSTRTLLLEELKNLEVTLLTNVQYKEITSKGIHIILDKKEHILPFDALVVAVGVKADTSLFKQLEGKVSPLYLVGDAREPGDAAEAIEEARLTALGI
jgi:2,4-dienoyl-CoA reductase-like NADH-dependent reductase (Old Yellow Enzyme family)/thioredoxin reductase